MHIEWRHQAIDIFFEMSIFFGVSLFECLWKDEAEKWQPLFEFPLKCVSYFSETANEEMEKFNKKYLIII